MEPSAKLCMGCMNELDNGICHYCNYTDDIPHLQSYLAPRTVLNDRYIVGKMLSYNGEGASYICYDMVTRTKAVLREYMPDTLCEREMRSNNIIVNTDCLAKYKTYMSEFQDMNRTLTRMRNLGSICTAKDMFSENNTCYVILEYVEGVSLKKFLQSNRGYLQWQQVKKLFVPLFTTMSIIHNAGIIHRGISPENIIVTTDGRLKLTGFNISSIRTANTALSTEFYSGYTAPEQYNCLEWQGTWTDVYSIAAVIYRILTGYVPPDANNRMNDDTMIPASRINPHIPRHVSNVLMHAMAVRSDERIKTITDLVSELFDNTPQSSSHVKGATQTIPVVKPQRKPQQKQPPEEAEVKKKTPPAVAIAGFILLALLLIIGIILLYEVFSPQEEDTGSKSSYVFSDIDNDSETLISESAEASKNDENSDQESPYGFGSIMPDLFGKRLDTVERELGEYFNIRTKVYYSDEYEKGTVTEQSIPAGSDYDPTLKNKLTLQVCMGPENVAVPEYAGYSKRDYLNILNDMNIKYTTIEESSYTVSIGNVIRTSIEPGYNINVKDGEVLVVYISSGLEVTSSSDSSEPNDSNSEWTSSESDSEDQNAYTDPLTQW